MGPSPAKPGSEKCQGVGEGIHYGVYLPPDVQPTSEVSALVFTDKSEALKLVKKYKKARFKSFKNMTDAVQFATFGLEPISGCPTSPPEVGEKPSPFRGPKPQDMVRFRKAIESGDLDFVKKTAWENPRYLVSSGDTPAILQEGSRYNALHIGAKACNAAICGFVLQTISSHEFMRHFYGDTVDTQQRCEVLLDLYLNTPDKGLNETPLHFASKYGASKVVQVLVAYSQCDRKAINKHRQTPKDVICTRMPKCDNYLRDEISCMLDEQFYVPVLRSPDNSVQPVVGEPFSPTSPIQERCHDVISPVLEVQALAGPMPKQTAELFRRRWKTPPRIPGSPLQQRRPTLVDQDKGWEKVGRELAQEWKVAWKEYWPFLNAYIDLSSLEGLQMLEEYLHKRFKNNSEDSSPNSHSISPPSQMNGVNNPESPMSELCNALRACRLSSGGGTKPVPRHHPPHPRQTNQQNGNARHADEAIPSHVTSPHLYMEKSCQVFAKRIVDGFCLGDGEIEFLRTEMKHLNVLVSSCLSDDRFAKLDFHHLHTRLGQLVAQKIDLFDISKTVNSLKSLVNRKLEDDYSSDEEEIVESPYSRRPRLDKRDKQVLHYGVICLAQAILDNINNRTDEPSASDETQPQSEQACAELWARADKCVCNFFSSRQSRKKFSHKKLVFNDDEFDEKNSYDTKAAGENVTMNCNNTPADSSGEESDTSDTSDHEFFTPPSSPGVRSDDDLAMESPDEGPDVYINGNTPSKLDISVMEAIKDNELSKAKFPNICRWRHLVLLHSEQERQRWISSPMHKTSCGSPSLWHRAPSLKYD